MAVSVGRYTKADAHNRDENAKMDSEQIVYETGIKMLELTTRKGDKTPLYFSVIMMSIVQETVCWTSGKSSLTRVWRHFANGYHC